MIEIDTIDDPRLAAYRHLKDRELARDGDRFIAEGWFIVQRLLAGDWPVDSVLVSRNRLAQVQPVVPAGVPLYVVPEATMSRIVGFKFHLGVIACGRRRSMAKFEDVLGTPDQGRAVERGRRTLLICPQVINHDNLGALARIAAALGADALVLGQRSCDPLWRRSIRVSMGAVFTLPIVISDDILADLRRLKSDWGVHLAAAVLDADAAPLHDARRPTGSADRMGLLIGPEDVGLHRHFVELADRKLTIPMAGGVDSLNIAVAAAIILHHFTHGAVAMKA